MGTPFSVRFVNFGRSDKILDVKATAPITDQTMHYKNKFSFVVSKGDNVVYVTTRLVKAIDIGGVMDEVLDEAHDVMLNLFPQGY